MKDFDFAEKIDRYLSGNLTPDERASFEHFIAADDQLAREVAFKRQVYEALRQPERSEFRERLRRIGAKHPPSPLPFFSGKKSILLILLPVVLLLAGAVFFGKWPFGSQPGTRQQPPNQATEPRTDTLSKPKNQVSEPAQDSVSKGKSNQPVAGGQKQRPKNSETQVEPDPNQAFIALANAHFDSVQFSPLRGGKPVPPNPNDPVSLAAFSFDNGEFEKAQQLAEAVQPRARGFWQAKEIAAHAAFRAGKFQEAAAHFSVLAKELSFQKEKSEKHWLLAMLAAGQTQSPDFQALLKKMQDSQGHLFHTEAIEIGERLKLEN